MTRAPRRLPDTGTPLWSPKQTAAWLGISEETLKDWRLNGKGPRFARMGNHVRYVPADVAAWVDEQREKAS